MMYKYIYNYKTGGYSTSTIVVVQWYVLCNVYQVHIYNVIYVKYIYYLFRILLLVSILIAMYTSDV